MNTIGDIKDLVWRLVLEQPELSDYEVADSLSENLSSSERAALAHEMLRFWSHLAHRDGQRTVERSSVAPKSRASISTTTSSLSSTNCQEQTPTMYERVSKSISQYIDDIKLELTDELLEKTFARGDGTQVKWGEATIEEHTVRAQRLRKLAVGNAEAAARHELAIKMLAESGSANLSELRDSSK